MRANDQRMIAVERAVSRDTSAEGEPLTFVRVCCGASGAAL